MADELYWFPLRHHSPTVASHVGQAIRERRPKLVFLEAPAGLEPLLPHLLDDGTRPPVALYSSFRDDQGQLVPLDPEQPPLQLASWYPLLAYSPEYVAIRAAHAVGAEVVFIDLPQHALAALRLARGPAAAATTADPDELGVLFERSSLFHEQARAAGYRHWDEAWDSLFEHGGAGRDREDYRRELITFCAAVRATTPATDAGTGARERHMWHTIEKTLAARGVAPRDAMVVCGGLHLFLDRDDPAPLAPSPLGTVRTALVPYSYLRVWERTGYAAGNRAPRFYQRLYEAIGRGVPDDALTEQSISILHRARRQGERVASADAIAVRHHAVLLAQLRGRAQPILDDLDDALLSCCVKGDPATDGALLRRVMREAHVGNAVGRVTPAAGRLPLVRDYYEQLERLGLAERVVAESVQWLELDRRDAQGAERSAFLHRLRQLEVPLAELAKQANPLSHSLFKERWRLGWRADIESTLIERSLDGDSVAGAALTAFTRELVQVGVDAGGACRLLLRAVAMQLPQLVVHAEVAAERALDEDGRLVSLADALTSLRVLERTLLAQQPSTRILGILIGRAWDRACFAIPEVVAAPREEHAAIVDALKSLAEVAQTRDGLDAELFASSVVSAAALSRVAELRGAFLAVLVDIRRLDIDEVAAELAAYAGSDETQQLQADDFLHAVFAVSTTAVMLGARALVHALDTLIANVGTPVFLAMLPRLRAAIELLHARHRDAFAAEVARFHGLKVDALDHTLSTSAAAQALIVELDREVAEIMKAWNFS